MNRKNNSGFIALMSAIVIAVVLLLVTTNLGFTGFYGRSNILDSELKKISFNLADACVDTAILKIANNPGYSGSESVTVSGSNTCSIDSIDSSTNPISIGVSATFQNATTKLLVKVDRTTLAINYYEEI